MTRGRGEKPDQGTGLKIKGQGQGAIKSDTGTGKQGDTGIEPQGKEKKESELLPGSEPDESDRPEMNYAEHYYYLR